MAYFQYLKELLHPLRLYELEWGAGMAELFAVGKGLDGIYDALEMAEQEAIPATASNYGLASYEEIMPFVPAYQLPEERRAAISALMRIDDMSFSLSALNSTVAGCGIDAEVREGDTAETVTVAIINTRGVPEDFSHIKQRIEQIIPCHLEVEYKFIYTTWQEFMGYIASWNEIEAAALSWTEMEIYIES